MQLLTVLNQDFFLLEMGIVGFGKGVKRRRFSLLNGNDDVGFAGPAGVIQIVARRRGGMIGVRVVVANYAELARPRIRICALALFGSNQIAVVSRVRSLVLARVDFVKLLGFTHSFSEQKATAFVRVGLLAVVFDLSEVFGFDFDRQSCLTQGPQDIGSQKARMPAAPMVS